MSQLTLKIKFCAIVSTFHIIIYICIFSSSQKSFALTADVVIPDLGKVIGTIEKTLWTEQTYISFLGIPYAESPKGSRRFQPPVAKRAWRKPFNATIFGKSCPEITAIRKMRPAELRQDLEDCLNLCIYTKNMNKSLPVMFYVHGGGFYNGSNVNHPPKHLLERDIVLVVPNYRIGALGFISDYTGHLPGNLALLDIFLALKWVKNYIETFGGDPENITVFGQSAGAALIGALLLSPNTSNDTFHRAIMQSGSIFGNWAINYEPRKQSEKICNALNCKSCIGVNLYTCLHKVTVPQLLNATEKDFFAIIVGDVYGVLPRRPSILFKNYNLNCSIMTGFTKDDGSFVLADYYNEFREKPDRDFITIREFSEGLMLWSQEMTPLSRNMLTLTLFQQHTLDSTDHKNAIPGYFDLASIVFIKAPVISYASEFFLKNISKMYLYSFDYKGENTRFGYGYRTQHYPFNGGIHHSNDNIYLFSTHTLNAKDTEFANATVEIWTSFAITGVPRTASGLELKPMENSVGPYFHINTNITIGENVLDELTSAIDDPDRNIIRPNIEF